MKPFRIVLVCAFFLTAPAIACADLDRRLGPPDGIQQTSATLADVLALNAKAEGKQLDSFSTRIEAWADRFGGADDIITSVWSGKDFKTTSTWGPIVEQDGRIAGVRWRQNFNGMVVIQGGIHQQGERFDDTMKAARAGSPGDAVKLLGEVTTPFPAYVLQVQPAGDPPTWLFIDKSSGLETRDEGISGAIRFTRTYRDFRTTDGATVPWIVESTDGRTADDSTTTRTSLKLNVSVSPTQLTLPQTKRQLVDFPAGATSVRLPASMPDMTNSEHVLVDNDYTASRSQFKRHMVVRVSINGRGLDFLLDSGAGAIFLDKQVADDLGLTQYPIGSQIFGGPTQQSYAVVPELRVGDLSMKNIVVVASPPVGFRVADNEKIAGILGYDFISNVGLKVDWDKGQITAYPPGTMQMPATAVTLPILLDDLIPYVPASIGDVASDHFLLDTGADDVYIFPAFARAHKAELADQGLGHRRQLDLGEAYSIGASGVTEVIPTQVKRFVFGVPFSEFIVQVEQSDAKYVEQDLDGLIGFHFLHYFNLYFDYPNSRIMLEPNDQFRNAKHIPAH
jgi:hypothetical protein